MKFIAKILLIMALTLLANILSALNPELTKIIFLLTGHFACTVFYYKQIFK